MADKITRIAIVDANRCKPKRCAQECKKVRRDVVFRDVIPTITIVVSCREDGSVSTAYRILIIDLEIL